MDANRVDNTRVLHGRNQRPSHMTLIVDARRISSIMVTGTCLGRGSYPLFPDFAEFHNEIIPDHDFRMRMPREYPEVDMDNEDKMEQMVLEAINVDFDEIEEWTLLGEIMEAAAARALHVAVTQNDCGMLRILLGHAGVDVTHSRYRYHTTRLLLAHGDRQIHKATESILHFAIPCAVKSVVEILLGDGRIDVNFPDENRRTALHIAASAGKMHVVQLLLAHRDIDMGKLDGGGSSRRALALCGFPETARCITVVQIARRKMLEYSVL
ncbi:unnamed protein product [Tuber aestivum]|uniref:Uncharacterized protein n=1 Tax=Tuber aestivum TaxID=59557 RepID=A0A292PQ47_9PEZI|nr:unnamed protein product [Tuber aestivum]